jgi:hypothetical protein
MKQDKFFLINKNYLKAGLLIVLYRILLDFVYYYAISPVYAYAGFTTDVNVVKLIESYFLLVLVFILLSKNNEKVSSLILQMFFLFMFVPLLTYYSLANTSREWVYLVSFFWIFVNILNRVKIQFPVKMLKQRKLFYRTIMICMPFLALLLIFFYYGFSFNFNLLKVYEIRAQHKLITVPFYFGYLIPWAGKIVLPFIILWSLYGNPYKKKLLILLLAVSAQVAIFAVTGHKSYLFRIPFLFGLIWLIYRKNFFVAFSFCLSSIVGLAALMYYFMGSNIFTNLMIRRSIFVQPYLSYCYYDFFKSKSIYLSDSIFRYFIPYPYELSPPFLIGSVYFKKAAGHANTGIVADSFMNFGYSGIFIWALALFLLLKLADTLTISKNKKIAYPIILLSFYTMTGSYLLTTILTHGLFLVFLLVYLLEREKKWVSPKFAT